METCTVYYPNNSVCKLWRILIWFWKWPSWWPFWKCQFGWLLQLYSRISVQIYLIKYIKCGYKQYVCIWPLDLWRCFICMVFLQNSYVGFRVLWFQLIHCFFFIVFMTKLCTYLEFPCETKCCSHLLMKISLIQVRSFQSMLISFSWRFSKWLEGCWNFLWNSPKFENSWQWLPAVDNRGKKAVLAVHQQL